MFQSSFDYRSLIAIFVPRLDSKVIKTHRCEGMDEGRGESVVGEERDVEVDGCTTDLVAVGELARGEVLRDIDHHVDLLVANHVESLRLQLL